MVEPLVLVHGDDRYLVRTAALRLRGQLSADLIEDLGLEEFRSSRDIDAIARSVATPPFLAIRRLVVIWDPPQASGGGRGGNELQQLIDALGQRLDTTALLVVCSTTVAPGSALLEAVRAGGGEVRLLKRPRGRELRLYVENEIRSRRLQRGRAAQVRLLDVAGQDLGRFHQELAKVEVFSAGEGRISDADALLLIPPAPPTELYRLTDTLFEAPARVRDRLDEIGGRSDLAPPAVVGALARVLRDLITLAEHGGASLPPWKEERMRSQLARAGAPRLRRWLVELADLDWSTRTGAVDGQEGLELLLASMASELSARSAN
ncbi:MAG TPA: hypothetical protein VI138_01735 [Candidatus Dormibacteraeota bacterium]